MKLASYFIPVLSLIFLLSCQPSAAESNSATAEDSAADKELRVLIIDGQNNHNMWPKTTMMMQQYLEETGRFTVDIQRTATTWKGGDLLTEFPLEGYTPNDLEEPEPDEAFTPDFSAYDVVLTNFGWRAAPLPTATQLALDAFVKNGGGLVVVHAADNSWPQWAEFNEMIGLGGWGDRTEKDGPYVYYTNENELVYDTIAGAAGGHGPQHEFQITIREPNHPITKGLPTQWLHTQDELYERLRGPAKNMTVLATAYASPENKGKDRHEPMLLTIDYGKGRVFHTPMGHADYSMECVGFIVSLIRGTEWAATGEVTLTEVPADFPAADKSSKRDFVWKK